MSIGCQWEPPAGMDSGGILAGSFLGTAGNKGTGSFVNSAVRQGMNFNKIPHVARYMNFIMHSSNHHNGNI